MTQTFFSPFITRCISFITLITASIVLCGWIFEIHVMKSFAPSGPDMKVNTAISFILTGLVFFLLTSSHPDKKYPIIFLSILTGLIAFITITENLTGVDTGLSTLPGLPVNSGKMSMETSLNFLTLSITFLLCVADRFYNLKHLLALMVMSIAFFEIAEHIYGVHASSDYYEYSSMAFPTCALFLLAGNGILMLNPDKGIMKIITRKNEAGKLGRTLLPFSVFIPLVIGWMTLKGEHTLYNMYFGMTLFTVAITIILSSIILLSAKYYSSLENKQSETVKQMEKKEKLFQTIVENNTDCILLSDKNFKPIYISPSANRMSGWSGEERNQIDWRERMHPDDLQLVKNFIGEVLNNPGKSIQVLFRTLHKEGHYIWVEGVITNMLHDPSIDAIVSNLRDVTDSIDNKKKLAKANFLLKQNETKLKEAQALAHMGNWEIDFKTGKCVWSDEAFRMYGLSPGEIEPSVEAFLSFIHKDDVGHIQESIEEASKTLQNTYFSFRFLPKTGGVRHAYSESRFEFGTDGRPVRLYGIIQDITERKQTEENLRAVNKELETFVYKATHDLRGPLSSIMGMIALGDKDAKDPEIKVLFEMIGKSAKKLDNTLLGLVESMNIKDTKVFDQKIDFDEITDEALKKFLHYNGYSRLNINKNISDATYVFSNRSIMESIFQNMIENAIKYQDYSKQESHLTIDISENQSEIRLLFQDNGIGIASSMHNRIFDMYYRGTTESKGSGLGLYLVKTGVDKLKGRIEVKSEIKNGTEFSIYIPKQLAMAS